MANPKPPSSGATRRMMTPPPPGQARKSTGSMPAATPHGSGSMQPVKDRGGTPPPPPAAPGGAGPAPGSPGRPAPRPIMKPKTAGMPIKTKIVVSMSTLAVGVSLMLFVIVMIISTASLDATIEQSGLGMLQQAEAIHRPYRAGLNEKGLIAYFSQPTNRTKFAKFWKDMQPTFFHSRIPPCAEFANWDQLAEDRVWIKVAGEVIDSPTPLPENVCNDIFGREHARQLRELQAGQSLPEPLAPRVLNYEAVNADRERFVGLFTRYSLDPRVNVFADLRAAINKETRDKFIEGQGGLRRRVFREFHSEFVSDLQKLTDAEGSQVKYIIFEIPANTLPQFSEKELNVVSPPTGQIALERSSAVKPVGNVEVDTGATVGGIEAYSFSTAKPLGDKITIYLDRQEIQSRKNRLLISILGISALAIGLAIGLAFVIGGGITKPLETLMTDIQIISGGNFDHKPLARSADEIGIVSRLLGDMAAGLKAAQEVWLENQGRKHDLDIAKEIQENLLPKHVPRIAGYDVSAYYSPSKEVGGDYYDFFLVDKTHLGMVCADVSGKGIPGSMVMMMCKALVSYEASENLSPRDIFCKVNRSLAKDIKRGMFVTAFYMLLDIPTARLTVASAGHNPLLLYRAATKQCTQINPGGIALGFDKDGRLFERNMKEEVIQLQRGDRAVIYTDGVTEAMSPSNEEFGEDRMMAITVQCAAKSSSEYLTQLVNAIQGHAQKDEQHDDITIVTLKVG